MVKLFFDVHLLKLFTGDEISTRPVRRSGKPGKVTASSIRSAAAEAKTTVFELAL